MTAHQRNAVLPEAFREVARLRHVGNEQVRVAEIIGDVPDRHLDADKASRMDHRPELCPLGNAEGQGVLGMSVDDGHDIWPRREDRRMNEALEIKATVLVADGLTL